jgi:hypothetical protein
MFSDSDMGSGDSGVSYTGHDTIDTIASLSRPISPPIPHSAVDTSYDKDVKVPKMYQQSSVWNTAKTRSYIYRYGVRLVSRRAGKEHWGYHICLKEGKAEKVIYSIVLISHAVRHMLLIYSINALGQLSEATLKHREKQKSLVI